MKNKDTPEKRKNENNFIWWQFKVLKSGVMRMKKDKIGLNSSRKLKE